MAGDLTEQCRQVLATVSLPGRGRLCGEALTAVQCDGCTVSVTLSVGYPLSDRQKDTLVSEMTRHLAAVGAGLSVVLTVQADIKVHAPQPGVKPLPHIKNVLAVASGKGGVGKSTTALNVAVSLARSGAAVGLLDADVYGPSQPVLLGGSERPEMTDDKQLVPVIRHGLKTMSMGYLVSQETPMVWRGPMISSALNQLINQTAWGELDYLVVDLPPGTGDIPLTLSKKIPVSGVLLVTTPQDVALADVEKAYRMFEKLEVPVLGVLENMAGHTCSACGHEEAVFGERGGEALAKRFGLPLLGSVPLQMSIRQAGDAGEPVMASAYEDVATALAATLAERPKTYVHLFPEVVVEKE